MRRRRRPPCKTLLSGKQRFLLLMCGALLVTGLFFTELDRRARPIVQTLALAELDNEVTGTVNTLCRQLAQSGTLTYSELCFDTDTSMTTNMETVNALRMTIGKGVSEVLDGQTRRRVRIPIGAVLNWNLFTALGPEISVPLLHVGQVSVAFDGGFQSSGINQTAHTLNMVVKVDVLLMLPGGISKQNLSCTVPLAEALRMGDVPQSYTNIRYAGAISDSSALQNETQHETQR